MAWIPPGGGFHAINKADRQHRFAALHAPHQFRRRAAFGGSNLLFAAQIANDGSEPTLPRAMAALRAVRPFGRCAALVKEGSIQSFAALQHRIRIEGCFAVTSGPELPFERVTDLASAATASSRWPVLQHFESSDGGSADKAAVGFLGHSGFGAKAVCRAPPHRLG